MALAELQKSDLGELYSLALVWRFFCDEDNQMMKKLFLLTLFALASTSSAFTEGCNDYEGENAYNLVQRGEFVGGTWWDFDQGYAYYTVRAGTDDDLWHCYFEMGEVTWHCHSLCPKEVRN